MTDQPKFKVDLPDLVKKSLSPGASKSGRMMIAKGALPMPPKILLTALTFLLGDADEEVQETAKATLLDTPTPILIPQLKDPSHAKTLDFFAREKYQNEEIAEVILLNPYTGDSTIEFLADKVSERHCTIIADNQVRLLRFPSIAEALRKNGKFLQSTGDRMVSFLRMNGIVLQGENPELSAEEIKAILEAPEPVLGPEADENLTEDIDQEAPEEEIEQKRMSIYQAVQAMNVAEKVKMALRGNKEARSLLIKESNKIVATAVVKNPRLTDGEVMTIAQMRTTHDEVIRLIARNPDWVKMYPLQAALANNPKTPFPIALKYMRMLHAADLKKLASNKNVPSQLSKLAKEFYEKKRK